MVRPLNGGHRSRLFLVSLSGQPCVARHTTGHEADQHWLVRVLHLARRAGLNPPCLIPRLDGQLTAAGWTLEQYKPGTAVSKQELRAIRPALSRFHALAHRLPRRPTPAARIRDLPRNLQSPVQNILSAHDRTTIIHGDLHTGNLLRQPDGRLVLLDWEEARKDLPQFDLRAFEHGHYPTAPHLAYETAAGWHREPARARQMMRRLSGLIRRI